MITGARRANWFSWFKSSLRFDHALVSNFFWRGFQMVAKEGVLLALYLIAARFLTPQEFGIYGYLFAVAVLLAVFTNFGISSATQRTVAHFAVTQSNKIQSVFFSSFILVSVLSVVISILFFILGPYVMEPENVKNFYYFLPYLLLKPTSGILDGLYLGLKRFRQLSLISIISGITSLLVGIVLIYLYSLKGFIVSISIIPLLSSTGAFLLLKEKSLTIDREIIKHVGHYSVWIGLASLSFFLYTKIDIIVLKQFNYVVEIGYYEIANRIFEILLFAAVIFGQVIGPNITRLVAQNKYYQIRRVFTRYILILFIATALASIPLYFLVPIVVKFVLPNYYTSDFLLILSILFVLFPIKFIGIVTAQGFITPGGYAKIYSVTTLIGGLLNVGFDFIFVKMFGFVGIFYGTLLVHTLTILATMFIFYKLIHRQAHVHTDDFAESKILS